MVPKKHKNLAESLRNLQKARRLSLAEFSRELDIPKSTLQAILTDGQTSLNTAMRISEKLSIPIDVLTNGVLSAGQIRILDELMLKLEWYDRLSKEKKKEAAEHVYALIQLIQESHNADPDEDDAGKRKQAQKRRSRDMSDPAITE